MGDFGNAIKDLYEKFILRDLLSFITPGAIIVLTAFLLFWPGSSIGQRLDTLFGYSLDMHWFLYIPLFGVFYMVGFAVQCFGQIVGLIRIHKIAESNCHQRRKIFCCNWANRPDIIWWKNAHEKVVKFYKKAQGVEWAKQQHERLVALKQMCANGSLAIVIAGILILINLWCESPWCLLIVGVPLLVSLFWGYRISELMLDTMDEEIKSSLPKGKQES